MHTDPTHSHSVMEKLPLVGSPVMWMIGPNDAPKRLIVDKFTKAEFQSIIPLYVQTISEDSQD